jgi:polygalacturonase
VTYINTCETGVENLIRLNPRYDSSSSTSDIPDFTNILVDGLTSQNSVSGASSQIEGYDTSHMTGLTLQYVNLDTTSYSAEYADVGTHDSDLNPSTGTSVSLTRLSSPVTSGSVPSCSFPGFPVL